MANVEQERVVTEFKLTLTPTEYRLIMDSLSTHLEELQSSLEKNNSDHTFDSTEFQEETISEVKKLKEQLESEYSSEWINE